MIGIHIVRCEQASEDEGAYVWFQPDTPSESEGADQDAEEGAEEEEEIRAADFEDPSIT